MTREHTLELAREWLAWQESMNRSRGTLKLYRRIIGQFCVDVVGERSPESVRADEIEQWLQRARDGRAQGQVAKPATQHRDAACIRGFYAWLLGRGFISSNPTLLVHTPTIRNVQPKPISDDVWNRLAGSVPTADAIALGLMFFCGLRREELTVLRVSSVDVGRRQLSNFIRKGGGEDILPVGTMLDVYVRKLPHLIGAESLWSDLSTWCSERDGNAFVMSWADLGRPQRRKPGSQFEPGQLDPQLVNHWLDRKCDAQRVGHVSPHQLRHSCATNLLRAGVPIAIVSTLLNHSNVHTTMRYVKAGGDELSEWLSHA